MLDRLRLEDDHPTVWQKSGRGLMLDPGTSGADQVVTPQAHIHPMRFTLRQLAYFVAAGETGSVTLASDRVGISQPSISTAISQLEVEFGLQLFVRHHAQGLSLTPAGERFLQAAKALLQQADGLHEVANEVAGAIAGRLQIGSFRTLSPLLVPGLCSGFLAKYPRVRFNVTEGDEASLLVQLRKAEIHLALTYAIHVTHEIAFEPLANLPTYIALAADHPLASQRWLGLSEIAHEPFILLNMPLSQDYFISLFAREGLTPNVVAQSDLPETVRSYVASGFGFSLMTARPANKFALNGRPLAYIRLKNDNPPMVLGLATLKGMRKTNTTLAFEDYCRDAISTDNLPGMADWEA